MRQILVDHARRRVRAKRGGKQQAIPIEEHHLVVDEFDADLVAVDDALRELAGSEPRAVRVVECRFFAGLSVEETAETLGIRYEPSNATGSSPNPGSTVSSRASEGTG